MSVLMRGKAERYQAGGVEAGAFGQQIGQRSQEQSGRDDEDQRQRHLQGDYALAQANAAELRTAALTERRREVIAASVNGWSEAADKAGSEAHQAREG